MEPVSTPSEIERESSLSTAQMVLDQLSPENRITKPLLLEAKQTPISVNGKVLFWSETEKCFCLAEGDKLYYYAEDGHGITQLMPLKREIDRTDALLKNPKSVFEDVRAAFEDAGCIES